MIQRFIIMTLLLIQSFIFKYRVPLPSCFFARSANQLKHQEQQRLLRAIRINVTWFNSELHSEYRRQLVFPIIDYGDILYENTFETRIHPQTIIVYNHICMYCPEVSLQGHRHFVYDTLNWPLHSETLLSLFENAFPLTILY